MKVRETARDCLKFDTVRSTTPPEIKKYRRSNFLQPGKRFQHYGITDDLNDLDLDNRIFGIKSDKGNGTTDEVIAPLKDLSETDRLSRTKAERVYKSSTQEPLGKKMERNIDFPTKFTEGKTAFGIKTKSSLEPAKDIIFPRVSEDYLQGDELYRKSHGSYAPGQQRNRDYDWPIDPHTTVFGMKAGTLAFNNVSSNISKVLNTSDINNSLVSTKNVEDFRNTGHLLGMSRNLGQGSGSRPIDMVYGLPSSKIIKSKGVHTAAEVMRGKYNLEQQMPDQDLGKSITPGFRNISFRDTPFGCPSIRSDLKSVPIGRRSIADPQNYGDDVPARDLIHPPAFSDLSLTPDAMQIPYQKDKLLTLFSKIGYGDLHPKISEFIFDKASNGSDSCSINSYRNTLNEYLDAVETGNESQWLQYYNINL